MFRASKKHFLILQIIIISSCGGVIGNIEKYRFTNTAFDSLESAVKKVFTENPQLKNFDTTIYKEGIAIGNGDFYCRIKMDDESDYLFQFAYPKYPSPNDTIVEIALTSANKYGSELPLSKKISKTNKEKYKKIFEKYFIQKVHEKLR